jgi:hypothetical protein
MNADLPKNKLQVSDRAATGLKFRVIQSNDRGLITKQGDRTYASRRPAKGEETVELPLRSYMHFAFNFCCNQW